VENATIYKAASNLCANGVLIKTGELVTREELPEHLFERFVEIGAIVPFNEESLDEAPAPEGAEDEGDGIDAMTVKQLVIYGKENGIEFAAGSRHADLVVALRSAGLAAPEEPIVVPKAEKKPKAALRAKPEAPAPEGAEDEG